MHARSIKSMSPKFMQIAVQMCQIRPYKIVSAFVIVCVLGLTINLLIYNEANNELVRNVADYLPIQYLVDTKLSRMSQNNPGAAFRNLDSQLQFTHVKSHPNIPKMLLMSQKISAFMPDLGSILWTGTTWQESSENFPKFLLYSAHRDYRGLKKEERVHIRTLGLYKGEEPPSNYSCYIWFNSKGPPLLATVWKYDLIGFEFVKNTFVAYLITCTVPSNFRHTRTPPVAVSIVQPPYGKATNILELTGSENPPPKKKAPVMFEDEELNLNDFKVGICMPALYFYNYDFSKRLIEWTELLNSMGANKFYAYRSSVHPNMDKVMKYYEEEGMMNVIDFNYPPPKIDYAPLKRLWTGIKRPEMIVMERIYHTDCILRYKDEMDYLFHVDPDEMPLLFMHKSLQQLVKYGVRERGEVASLRLRWLTFFTDLANPTDPRMLNLSDAFYILRHDRYVPGLEGLHYHLLGKTIYSTKYVLAANSHLALFFVGEPEEEKFIIPEEVAQLAHYRYNCSEACKGKARLVKDTTLYKYAKKVISYSENIIKKLQLDHV